MTSNQIAFQNLKETIRNNVANLSEMVKHNRNVEDETRRSNVAREQQLVRDADERRRMNNATILNNQIVNAETRRSHIANEQISSKTADANVYASQMNARTSAKQQEEIARYNRAQEKLQTAAQAIQSESLNEQRRSNVARETNNLLQLMEVQRSNLRQEDLRLMDQKLSSRKLDIDTANLEETKRAHNISETHDLMRVLEQQRANKAQERLSWVKSGTSIAQGLLIGRRSKS